MNPQKKNFYLHLASYLSIFIALIFSFTTFTWLYQQVNNQQELIKYLQQNQNTLNDLIDQSNKKINNLQQKLNFTNIFQQLNDLSQQVNLTNVDYQNLQQNIDTKITLINSLNSLIQSEQIQATNLQSQLNTLQNQKQNYDINQKISQLQINLSNLNSSIQQVNQSIPAINIYKIQTKQWINNFAAPQPENIIMPELSKILNIKATSIVRLTLNGQYCAYGNEIFISFAVNGIAISPFYNQMADHYYMGGFYIVGNTWNPISFSQKVILQPGINNIQLIANLVNTNGSTIGLNGAILEIEIETLAQSN
ncbi:hypothetical protein ABPG74_017314 [Tetrahymena malaccensis]